jgi:TRAP-type C4-dicarboxylate transport system substrate-binding protein
MRVIAPQLKVTKTMMQKIVAACLIGTLLVAVPASSMVANAAETQYLKIATLAPRDSDLAKGFMKLDQGMRSATQNAWGVKLYPSGVAGDETDVLRKMKVDQMDASIITSVGLSQIVHETALLNTPGVIRSYKQLEAVQAAMTKEWETAFEKAGFKLLAWGETGQLRWFAKQPLTSPSSVKNMRPWVWPAAHAMKETLHAIGANGVPLGVPEVYGALQTGMIDIVTTTAVALVTLQWHAVLKYMTKNTTGVLVGGLLMNTKKWASIPPDVQKVVASEVIRNQASDRDDIRKADERSYQNLLKRGYTANEWTGAALVEYETMADTVQKRLAGRMYSAETLERVKKIAASAN